MAADAGTRHWKGKSRLVVENECLLAENYILKSQIEGRLLLSETEKTALAEIAQRLGRKALEKVAAAAV